MCPGVTDATVPSTVNTGESAKTSAQDGAGDRSPLPMYNETLLVVLEFLAGVVALEMARASGWSRHRAYLYLLFD